MAVAEAQCEFSQRAIEELLECTICLGRLTDPRVLSCQHYFCKKCLQGCVGPRGAKSKSLKCAVCRKTTKLSFEGVGALPANYAVKGLLEMARRRKQGNDVATESTTAQSQLDLKNIAKVGGKKSSSGKGREAAHAQGKTSPDRNSNFGTAKRNKLVMVRLSSSSETNDSESEDASSSDESESDTSETSDCSDESSCSSLSDDTQSTDSESNDESSEDSLPSASMAFGEMNMGSEVYVFSKVRKPVKGKLVHVKGYGRQLFAGIELESGNKSWMKSECGAARGTSLHQWWKQRNSARAVVHLDDCLPASVVEMMK